MAEPRIDVDGLPFGVSGPYDTVVGVDEATGAARRFPMPQAGTPRSYATRASLPAASGFAEGYTVWVNNDPTPANNGTWAVLGGVWVQSADRVTGLEQTTERIVTGSTKNLFDPAGVISGYMYQANGAQRIGSWYRVTPKYPVAAGQSVAISGIDAARLAFPTDRHINFWDGSTHVGFVPIPAPEVNMDWMVATAPAGATSFSMNLSPSPNPLPQRLQIEIAPRPTAFEPRRRTQTALPEASFENLHFEVSAKNLFDGRAFSNRSVSDGVYSLTGEVHRVATSFIPVEFGKTYTISGLDPTLAAGAARVVGVGDPKVLAVPVVELFGQYTASTKTITVTNPATRFIALQLSSSASRYLEAFSLRIQVEEGTVATDYEPRNRVRGINPSIKALESSLTKYIDARVDPLVPRKLASLDEMLPAAPNVTPVAASRRVGPYGAAYLVSSTTAEDAKAGGLFAEVKGIRAGLRSIYAYIAGRNVAGTVTIPRVTVTPFSVPSGQLIHEGPSGNWGQIGWPDDYVHPSVAYSATGVAGYKYWMIASILPGYSVGGAVWEDEDIFVSNDAKSWLRIRSPYEADRADTAPGLVLPPHALVSSGGRRYAFLPCPAAGDVIEISVPATAVGPELNNVNITLTNSPWKHDPAIMIEGGYVYVYHTFHLSYATHPGGNNKFIVCTRTNDGVNWECVRSDGSTLPLTTAAASRQMFTKDGSGRYNYLHFPGAGAYSNPEVVKYGSGDFEFVYGENFTRRYAGTTPWSFNFAAPLPMQSVASGNHPGLMVSGGTLYLLNQTALYQSTDRGQTFTQLANFPGWRGGNSGQSYKKAMCVGEGGKVVLFDTYSGDVSASALPIGNQYQQTQRRNKTFVQEFPSVATFVGYATNGIGDGYIDVQVDQLNYSAATRKTDFYPYRGNVTASAIANNPHQRVKIADVAVAEGDTLYVYITLVARSGGSVSFNGLEVI